LVIHALPATGKRLKTPGDPQATTDGWYGTRRWIMVPIVRNKDRMSMVRVPSLHLPESREPPMDRITREKIIKRGLSLGASCVGIVPVDLLRDSPSHRRYAMDLGKFAGSTAIVLALEHPPEQPEMDWWDNWQGGTPGNRRQININHRLVKWLRKKYTIEAVELPYQVERNGIFLKDAAILAGLGVMGRNNLLITPCHGPRVRLKALVLDLSMPATASLVGFDPCNECPAPCLCACPQEAFASGSYDRERCQLQMKADEANPIALGSPVVGMPTKFKVAYCRLCELSCPVGGNTAPQLGVSP
jgi:epoxyqueuosine reductase